MRAFAINNQLDHMNRELVQFIQRLGHSDVALRCDNEPAILQLQRLATKTRQSMGLKTRMDNSVAYDHGNSLAENGIARVRQLAASLMHQLHGRLGLQLSTGSAIWTWALRHAEWLISRFSVLRGATPYELALGRQYKGDLCEYGEPVYGYVHPGTNKAAARWRRALFLGNADSQNSFVLFDGQSIVLSKSIRRISTTWRSHLAYYLHCKCYSWQFKSGFGARILPTMKKAIPQSASLEVPLAPIESSKLHDPEAEAVIQYAEQEKKAEEEQIAMSLNDPINVHAQVQQQQQAQLQEEPTVFDDGQPVGDGVVWVHNPEAAGPVPLSDPGLAVPVTPPRDDVTLDSPRGSSTVRANNPGGAESEESKRAKVEESKKQRINRLQLEYEERLSAVRIAYKEYFTMDDYSTDQC